MTEEDKTTAGEVAEGFSGTSEPAEVDCAAEAEARAAALEAELARVSQERADMAELARRLQADFDNFRRRTREEALDLRRTAAANLILEILPALDNLDRALGVPGTVVDGDALRQGVALTRDQLFSALAGAGLEPVPAVGQKFDPQVHEALERVESGEPGEAGEVEHVVVEEFRRGYLLGGRLLRPSLVQVAPKVRRD